MDDGYDLYDIQQQCVVFLYDTLVDKMTNKYEISGPGVGGGRSGRAPGTKRSLFC